MPNTDIKREIRGLLFLALSVFLFLSLFSYDRLDPSLNVSSDRIRVVNYAGPVGAYTADLLILFFGLVAYVIAGALLIAAFQDFRRRQVDAIYTKLIGLLLLVLSTCGFLDLMIQNWQTASR